MLSSSNTYWFLVIFHQLSQSYASFTTGSKRLPRVSRHSAVGYDNDTDTILIFGSLDSPRQFIQFQNHAFNDMGSTYLSASAKTYSSSQHYTQTENKLWMINGDGTHIFRVDTNTYNEDPHLSQYQIPTTSPLSYRACLASLSPNYLFVVGGGDTGALTAVQAYDIQNGEWLTNVRSMNQIRRSFSCIVVHSTLYAIGGFTNSVRLTSIERLDVSDLSVLSEQRWSYLSGSLTRELSATRAVAYGDDILVIGGRYIDQAVDDIHIIDTAIGSCQLWDNLNIAVATPLVIITDNVLYVFAGWTTGFVASDKYQYKVLPTKQPTAQPTSQPTLLPTSQPASQPTPQPTPQPTSQPTSQPKSHPTAHPTISPITSSSATLLSSSYPSLASTISPTNAPSSVVSVPTIKSTSNELTYSSFEEHNTDDNTSAVSEDANVEQLLIIMISIVVGLVIVVVLSIIMGCIYFKYKKRATISGKDTVIIKIAQEQNSFGVKQTQRSAFVMELEQIVGARGFEEGDDVTDAEGNSNGVELDLEEGEFEVIGDDDINTNTRK
eukprot:435240_1